MNSPKKRILHEDDYKYVNQQKVVICTPSNQMTQATFAYDLGYLMRESGATFILSMGCQLPTLRSSLVKWAIDSGATHLLFIDSDMRFPSDTITQLISRRKDVIGANCRVRVGPDNMWTARRGQEFISSVGKTGVEEIETLGFGVTMIDTKVFEKVEEPMFGMPWDGEKYIGEDIFFCVKLREAGYSIWIDHDLSQFVKHTAEIEKGVE